MVRGDWPQGWPAGGDLQEGSFQLPAGTKPALKGIAAEGVCPSQSVAPKQPGSMWEGKQGHQRGERTCLVPNIIRVPAAPLVVWGRGPGPGNPAGCSPNAVSQYREM